LYLERRTLAIINPKAILEDFDIQKYDIDQEPRTLD
jgi:hypothetical protein